MRDTTAGGEGNTLDGVCQWFARGPHARAAVALAASLARGNERKLTGVYVEPDIGPDARRVAIVFASALSLWALGLRSIRKPTGMTRALGVTLTASALAMTIGLALSPTRLAAPHSLIAAIEDSLPDGTRLRQIRLKHEADGLVVQVDLGGHDAPDRALREELLELAHEHIGKDTGVRMTFRHETLLR